MVEVVEFWRFWESEEGNFLYCLIHLVFKHKAFMNEHCWYDFPLLWAKSYYFCSTSLFLIHHLCAVQIELSGFRTVDCWEINILDHRRFIDIRQRVQTPMFTAACNERSNRPIMSLIRKTLSQAKAWLQLRKIRALSANSQAKRKPFSQLKYALSRCSLSRKPWCFFFSFYLRELS